MIIREIELHNIRSHKHTTITLGPGTYLFEGDIGSGKTTILMGIEFAMFGNSTPAFYRKLLRKGETAGHVKIRFEHEGTKYEIYRSLKKKGKGISNDESYIILPEGKKPLSPGDIQPTFLKILGINVKSGSKKSLPIVTYSIYTPQETMKSILTGKPDERLGIIRKIFNLDEYKIASENARLVSSNIRAELSTTRAWRDELKNIHDEIQELNERLDTLNTEQNALKKELEKKRREVDDARKKLQELEKIRTKYESLSRTVAVLQGKIEDYASQIEQREKELKILRSRATEAEQLKKDAEKYEALAREEEELRKAMDSLTTLRNKLANLEGQRRSIEHDLKATDRVREQIEQKTRLLTEKTEHLSKYEDIDAKLRNISKRKEDVAGELKKVRFQITQKEKELDEIRGLTGTCPVCKRPLTDEHKRKLEQKEARELNTLKARYAELQAELEQLARQYEETERASRKMRELNNEITAIKSEINALKQQEKTIREKSAKLSEIQKEIDSVKSQITPLTDMQSRYDALRKELKSLEKLWRRYHSLLGEIARIATLESALEKLQDSKRRAQEALAGTRRELAQLNYSETQYLQQRKEYETLLPELSKTEERLNSIMSEIRELNRNILRKKAREKELNENIALNLKLEDFKNWMDEKFIPALDDIEKSRLITINDEFKTLFESWFKDLLGESDYSATVDDSFSPIIRYDKYDMPIDTLSGGERTSVALAYRLTLNTMVKRALGLNSNLLILDEPTDGFSKDQLYKLKDILDGMETDQIIIVSHETELRNLADTIYKVEKLKGDSIVRIV